ncbi:AarF/ABC1/UbiB kinase family protein [Halorussus gelatinilyticus]|uniref:AarF/ABC1/UbiB kinase family protein n=1 Tax=Halorussus gelatinilyticus TaxID=2937524 RepID=A0A8U0IJL3_9EURY|nr:AarF/ABC1/UbiB kinase family protein [Halorussus gelatinilyticus]UPW00886.1 AarF/ABC1/UbiB kinase family protein [Halorussus gelatinilyticus]
MVTLVNLRAYRRFFVVAYHFLPLLLSYARDRRRFLLFGSRRRVDSETRVERANTLLESLLTLGPTFIKLGQLLSTRPDVLPPEYVEVLSKLQDEVPPADWAEARAVLEDEVGPIEERFDAFDTDAISGASLGQVYIAEIDGKEVAVKVRRPNIEELVNADLRVIQWSLPVLMRFIGQARAFSLETLADEFDRTIRQEMDYEREAAMLEEIRSNFEGNEDVAIPAVVDSHSGQRVLTMEYITGTKINDVEELDAVGVDRHQLAVNLQEAYLQMLLEDGVFHADPHPGNLAVRDDGTIVFYDFGMSGRVDEFVQDKIIDFYIAVANQDIDGILDALVEMGTLSPEADRATMGDVMELAIEDARGEDIETYRVQQIVEQVEDTIYEFPLRLPSNLALVLRVATVVEGVCVTLDPDFDFISVATDYLTAQGYREESIKQFASQTGDQIQRSIQSSVRVPPKLEDTLDRIEREDFYVRADVEDGNDVFEKLAKRLVYGMLLASGAFSTAFLYALTSVEAAAVAAVFSFAIAALLYRTFRGRKGTRVTPQFTRHEMRQRRGGE